VTRGHFWLDFAHGAKGRDRKIISRRVVVALASAGVAGRCACTRSACAASVSSKLSAVNREPRCASHPHGQLTSRVNRADVPLELPGCFETEGADRLADSEPVIPVTSQSDEPGKRAGFPWFCPIRRAPRLLDWNIRATLCRQFESLHARPHETRRRTRARMECADAGYSMSPR